MAALARLKAEHVELSASLSKKEHALAAPTAAADRGDDAAMLLLDPDPEGSSQSGSEARTAGEDVERGPCGGSAGSKRQRRWGPESSGGKGGDRSLLSGVSTAMAEWQQQQAAGRMRQQAPEAEVSGTGVAADTGKPSIGMPMPAMGSVMEQVAADEIHLDDGRHGEVDGGRGCRLDEDLGAGEGGGCDGGRGGAAEEGVQARLQAGRSSDGNEVSEEEEIQARLQANLKEQVAAMVRCVQAVLLPWPAEQRVRTSLLMYPRSLGMPDFIAVIAAAAGGSGPVALPDAEDGQNI